MALNMLSNESEHSAVDRLVHLRHFLFWQVSLCYLARVLSIASQRSTQMKTLHSRKFVD